MPNCRREFEETKKSATVQAIARAPAIENTRPQAHVSQLETTIKLKQNERESLRQERNTLQKQIDVGVGVGLQIQAIRDTLGPPKEALARASVMLTKLRLEDRAVGRVRLLGGVAQIPGRNSTEKFLLSSAAGVLGFLGVVLLVACFEWQSYRVDGVAQVAELGIPILGIVPAFPDRANLNDEVDGEWPFVINEAINSTRALLLHAALRGRCRWSW